MAIKLGEIDLTTGQIPELNAVGLRKTALSGQTRSGLFSSMTENGDVKVYSDVTFTTAESPDGTATTKFAVTVNRIDANNGGMIAVSNTGGAFTCGVNGGTYSSWKNSNDGDGVWHNLTAQIQYCKKNGYVTIEGGEFTIPTPTSGAIAILGTLPEGYRPAIGVEVKGMIMKTYGQEMYAMCWTTSSGVLCAWNTTGAPVAAGFRMFLSYPAA